jgi:3-phosphoshikimate 1-carboxyvinyltransferase
MRAPRTLVVPGGTACQGSVRTPGEKSISHRSVLLAALAEGTSVVQGLSDGADVAGTLGAVEAMGVEVERTPRGDLVLHGGRSRLHAPTGPIDCGNSGTSMRLLAGMVAGFGWETELVGDASLSLRPMDRVAEPLELMGARVEGSGDRRLPPLRIRGGALVGIDWTSQVASAQVKSAILLAGLSASGPTTVREPVTTRTHTEEMLVDAGVDLSVEPWGAGRVVTVRPSTLRPVDRRVPGDPSAAAFFVVAGCVVPQSVVDVRGVYQGPARLGFATALRRMGGQVVFTLDDDNDAPGHTTSITAQAGPLRGTDVAAAEIPSLDEIPALAVAAAVAEGVTVFHDVGELRVKEVDRLAAVIDLVRAFGGQADASGDDLRITGVGPLGRLHGAHFDSRGDHRMAMAAAIAALAAGPGERSIITGFDATETSYPAFAEHLRSLVASDGPLVPRPLVIAIDGPAGAGKSTVSRAVAKRLGLDRLDTGAMYRAVAALALSRHIAPDDELAVAALAAAAAIAVGRRVVIDDLDVTDVIRSPEVGRAVSLVAANAGVRRHMVARQRGWALEHGGGVIEGRDIGSVVFPEAAVKVYLTASPEERARRRRDEPAAGVARRDHLDSTRVASPLVAAPDAHFLDTTGRSVHNVVEEVLSWL